jgi:hypothetical protein
MWPSEEGKEGELRVVRWEEVEPPRWFKSSENTYKRDERKQ